jgi:hypothetical protein
MTAIYDGLNFKTPLEAQWAAFFDLAGWTWHTNPASVGNWAPDFRVEFPCGHSECNETHTLLVAVLPYSSIEAFGDHPSLSHCYGIKSPYDDLHPSIDAGAAFGTSPQVTVWEFSHGAGGGQYSVRQWESEADSLWFREAQLVHSSMKSSAMKA